MSGGGVFGILATIAFISMLGWYYTDTIIDRIRGKPDAPNPSPELPQGTERPPADADHHTKPADHHTKPDTAAPFHSTEELGRLRDDQIIKKEELDKLKEIERKRRETMIATPPAPDSPPPFIHPPPPKYPPPGRSTPDSSEISPGTTATRLTDSPDSAEPPTVPSADKYDSVDIPPPLAQPNSTDISARVPQNIPELRSHSFVRAKIVARDGEKYAMTNNDYLAMIYSARSQTEWIKKEEIGEIRDVDNIAYKIYSHELV